MLTWAFVPRAPSEYYGYYLVYTSAVTVAGTAVAVTDVNKYGGLVVDTGTTLHYLPAATVRSIEAAVAAAAPSVATADFFEWTACIAESDLWALPAVTYTLATSSADGAVTFDVVLEPAHYLLEYSNCYYWGFEASTLGIFGNIGMKGRVVHFDVTHNRVGFGSGVCSSATDDAAVARDTRNRQPALAASTATAAAAPGAELAAGGAAVLAVAGSVLLSTFVALRKFASRKATRPSDDENQALLPVL